MQLIISFFNYQGLEPKSFDGFSHRMLIMIYFVLRLHFPGSDLGIYSRGSHYDEIFKKGLKRSRSQDISWAPSFLVVQSLIEVIITKQG
jgi:hypothetical protein